MGMRVRSAAVTGARERTIPLTAALPHLTPRLALVVVGTLLQTIAVLGWMSLSPRAAGFALAVWPVIFLCAVLCLGGAAAAPAVWLERRWAGGRLVGGAGAALLVAVLALCVAASLWAAADVVLTEGQDPAAYVSDAAAFNHFDAQLVLAGRNPYVADDAFWAALRQFPASAATPLRRGRFARDVWAPETATLRVAVRAETADPAQRDGAFAPESLHSYPALSFLLYVPGVWAGLPSTLPVSLLGLCALLAAIGLRLPPGHRVLGWALLLGNAPALILTLRGSFEVFALLPVVLAWQWLPRRWLSALLLGVGCAVKQVVWPLVPLYLVVCARRYGAREALRRAAIGLAMFLAPNVPFIVLSPAAWARSMLLPMTLPLFPDGIGLVALAHAGLMPLLPQPVYTAMELLALVGVTLWVARSRRTRAPEVALPLGVLPLALAWRSLLAYFVWLPALALVAAVAVVAVVAATVREEAAHDIADEAHRRRAWGNEADWQRLRARARRLVELEAHAVVRWAARAEVRAALAATAGLRLATSVMAALFLGVTTGWASFRSVSAVLVGPWNHFDTAWYTDIAAHGYARFGSTAFMPLYPFLTGFTAHVIGGNLVAAGLLISTIATFFAFEALYLLSARLTGEARTAGFTLFVAVLLPTAFMLMAAYTDALFLALALWAALAALDGRWGRVALLGALAALTRQQGVLLGLLALPAAAATVVEMMRARGQRPSTRAVGTATALMLPGAIYGLWLVWLAVFARLPLPWQVLSAASGWNQHLTVPGLGVVADVRAIVHPMQGVAVGGPALDAVVSLAALGALVALWRRLPVELSLYLVATWCLSQTKVLADGLTASEARYMLQLVPLVILPAGWLARGGLLPRLAWLCGGMLVGSACLWAFTLSAWVP